MEMQEVHAASAHLQRAQDQKAALSQAEKQISSGDSFHHVCKSDVGEGGGGVGGLTLQHRPDPPLPSLDALQPCQTCFPPEQ